jgi:hypothetical protein
VNYCELCHEPTRNRKRTGRQNYLMCGECRYWDEVYAGYTAEDWQAEYEAEAAYHEDLERRQKQGEPL